MDDTRRKVDVDVFERFAPVIDYCTIHLMISTAFGTGWEMYDWNISVAFTKEMIFTSLHISDFQRIFLMTFVLSRCIQVVRRQVR